jgi:hypothetical protein
MGAAIAARLDSAWAERFAQIMPSIVDSKVARELFAFVIETANEYP